MMKKQLYLVFLLLLSVQLAIAQTTRYEYWLDNDHDGRTVVANNAEDVTLDLDISAMKPGLHYFNFRTQSSSGQWGGLSRYLFMLKEGQESTSTMTQYEYWLDNDYEQRTVAQGSVFDSPMMLDITNLKSGLHYFNFRTQSKSGQWGGLSRYLFFVKQGGSLKQLTNVEYWIDERRNVMTQQVTDSTVVITMDISDLNEGNHTFFVEGRGNQEYTGLLGAYEFVLSEVPVVPHPVITHEGNMVNIKPAEESQSAEMAEINPTYYYTQDGSDPDSTCTKYDGPFEIIRNCVVKAIGYQEEFRTSQIDSLIVDWFKASNVTFSQNGYVVSMNTDTEGANIRYMMSGSGTGEQTYLEPLTMTGDCTIEAYAIREGYNNSDTTRYVFVAADVTVATPVIGHEGNVISINCDTEQAVIHYTTDGSEPTAESPAYTGSFEVSENGSIKAIALRQNWFSSAVATLDVDWISVGSAMFDGLVLTVGENTTMQSALDLVGGRDAVVPSLAAIVWKSDRTISNSDMQGLADNPNLLLYVQNKALAPGNVKNIVVGDSINGYKAQQIVLTDTEAGNGNFYCPIAFTASRITYQRTFGQQTESGKCRGWETIALPFTVQSIMHERNGLLRPFAAEGDGRPFWLRALGSNGFVDAKQIEANKAYVISMPNEPGRFDAEYQLGGRVTFSGYGCQVPVTSRETSGSQAIRFIPALSTVAQSDSVYALNVGEEYAVGATIHEEGSIFVAGWSNVRPFHCYTQHTSSSPAPRYMPLNGWLDESTTSINEKLEMSNEKWEMTNEKWYMLDGRKLQSEPRQRGVYIMNGKKVKK